MLVLLTVRPERPLVLTPCSARKQHGVGPSVEALPRGPQAAVVAAWLVALESAARAVPARDLYKGRAFALAKDAADLVGADLGVISAGLGYVRADTAVPTYDLTISASGSASVGRRVQGSFAPRTWWAAVSTGPHASSLPDDLRGRPLVLACLSRPYASLVADDLLAAGDGLRVFGLSIDRALPDDLRRFVMPYDARLESLGQPGMRMDFAARALLDFARYVLPHAETLEEQRALVRERMEGAAAPPARPPRRRADDEGVREIIRRLVPEVGSASGAVLRHLRHVEGVSCEQARFARLFRDICAEAAS